MATLSLPPPAKAQKYIEYSMENELRGFNSSVKVPTLKLVTVDRVDGKGVVVYRFKSEKHLDNNYGTVHVAAYCAFVDIFASSCVSIGWTKDEREKEYGNCWPLTLILIPSPSSHPQTLFLLPTSDVASFYSGKRKSMVWAWLLPESSDSLSPFYSHRRMGGSRKHSRFGRKEFGCSPKHLSHRRSKWWKNWEGCFCESYKNQHCHFHDEAKVKDLTVNANAEKDGFFCLDDSIDAIGSHSFANWYAWLLSTSKCRRQCTSLIWSAESCRKVSAPEQSDFCKSKDKSKQFEKKNY